MVVISVFCRTMKPKIITKLISKPYLSILLYVLKNGSIVPAEVENTDFVSKEKEKKLRRIPAAAGVRCRELRRAGLMTSTIEFNGYANVARFELSGKARRAVAKSKI